MKTSRIQVPHAKASRHVRPRGEVCLAVHAKIKQIRLPFCIRDKVFEVSARVFRMIQKFGFPERWMNNKKIILIIDFSIWLRRTSIIRGFDGEGGLVSQDSIHGA